MKPHSVTLAVFIATMLFSISAIAQPKITWGINGKDCQEYEYGHLCFRNKTGLTLTIDLYKGINTKKKMGEIENLPDNGKGCIHELDPGSYVYVIRSSDNRHVKSEVFVETCTKTTYRITKKFFPAIEESVKRR